MRLQLPQSWPYEVGGEVSQGAHSFLGIKRSFTIELLPRLCSSRDQTTTFYLISKQLYEASVGLANDCCWLKLKLHFKLQADFVALFIIFAHE